MPLAHQTNVTLPYASQNPIIVEVGRCLWRSSNPTPVILQDQQQQVAQDHVQLGFECLKECRLHNLSGNLFQCSVASEEKCSLIFKWIFLCFGYCLLPCVLSLHTTQRSLNTFSLLLPAGNKC